MEASGKLCGFVVCRVDKSGVGGQWNHRTLNPNSEPLFVGKWPLPEDKVISWPVLQSPREIINSLKIILYKEEDKKENKLMAL